MVGVAGKSKGCATCRRRKIKCDEAKPICRRCEHSKLQCDRYERFPIFIDRTQAGYRKRAPLEEVKLHQPPALQSPQHIPSPEVENVRLISWFRETHAITQSPQHVWQTETHWLSFIGTRPQMEPALKAALLAVSFAKWSQVEGNPALRQNARKCYQQSLELTQKALSCEESALADDILATTCVMTLYELSDTSQDRSNTWLNHVTGAGNLLCLRGPQGFMSAESRVILEHMRYIFMLRCLATRTSCVFASLDWRESPWSGVCKSIEQQIFDQGLRLTSLWRDCDSLNSGSDCISEFQVLLSTCVDVFEALEGLICKINPNRTHEDLSDSTTLVAPLLTITALGIQLGSAASAQKLLQVISKGAPSETSPADPRIVPDTTTNAQNLSNTCKPLARTILRLVEARSKTQAGALANARMLWSIQLAKEQFKYSDLEMTKCKELIRSLSEHTAPFDALAYA